LKRSEVDIVQCSGAIRKFVRLCSQTNDVSSKSDSHGALRGADGHPRAVAVLPMARKY
jgi:hypothetical protein